MRLRWSLSIRILANEGCCDAIYMYFLLRRAPKTSPDLDFKEKWHTPNEIELFQLTPELSLQIPILASWTGLPKVVTANTIFSCLEHIFAFGKIFGFRSCERASKSGHSNYEIFTFGTYFGLRQDIWFLKVRITNWAGFQKWSQQTPNLHVWSIFWYSARYLFFGSQSGYI